MIASQLNSFLSDVACGIWGKTTLTDVDINAYIKKSTKLDDEVLEEFFYTFTSSLSTDEDIDIDELEKHIYDVIKN